MRHFHRANQSFPNKEEKDLRERELMYRGESGSLCSLGHPRLEAWVYLLAYNPLSNKEQEGRFICHSCPSNHGGKGACCSSNHDIMRCEALEKKSINKNIKENRKGQIKSRKKSY